MAIRGKLPQNLKPLVPVVKKLLLDSFGQQAMLGAPQQEVPTREEEVAYEVDVILSMKRPERRERIESWGNLLRGEWTDALTREFARDVLAALLPKLQAKAIAERAAAN